MPNGDLGTAKRLMACGRGPAVALEGLRRDVQLPGLSRLSPTFNVRLTHMALLSCETPAYRWNWR
jgi:hypothetical protein